VHSSFTKPTHYRKAFRIVLKVADIFNKIKRALKPFFKRVIVAILIGEQAK